MQDKALQSEKMQDNPAKSRTFGNSEIWNFMATVYYCTQHQLLKCFSVDVSQDDSTIHPLKFCNPCYAVTRRWSKTCADGVHYTHSVEPIDWSPHTESTCLVRRSIGIIAMSN